MPNRIIKESTFTSDKIALLSDFEFRLWVGLITIVDDAGRGDARPAIIKGKVFALRERTTIKDIEQALHGLAAKGCVSLYTVGGKPYFWFPTWSEHQRIRDCKPKYPPPDDNDTLRQSAATCGELPPESNPIQSESNSNPIRESESNPNLCTEPDESASVPQESDAVIFLPLNDKSNFPIFQEQVDEWRELYPAVDVMQQLRAMKGWLDSNPSKRKTKGGILRFINGWLAREQDKGGVKSPQNAPKSNGSNPFLAMLREEEDHDPF